MAETQTLQTSIREGRGSNPAMERLGAFGRWYETVLPSIRTGSDPLLNWGLLLSVVATCALAWWACRERPYVYIGDRAG